METITALVDGEVREIPVLTNEHCKALTAIKSGKVPDCSSDIIQDLVNFGLIRSDFYVQQAQ